MATSYRHPPLADLPRETAPPHVTVDVAARTDAGKIRARNEDAFTIVDLADGSMWNGDEPARVHGGRHVLLAVADGLGGQPGGHVASAVALETFARSAVWSRRDHRTEQRVQTAVLLAHRAVRQTGTEIGLRGMGATLVAVLVDGASAWITEVGDSRAYLVRGASIVQLSRDQSMVQQMMDDGMLTAEEARTFPFRNVVTQTIGMEGDPRVPVRRLALRRGDRILLCSDGLTELVTDEEIGSVVLASPDLAGACQTLVDLANRRGGVDNITVVLAEASGELLPPSPWERIAETITLVRP